MGQRKTHDQCNLFLLNSNHLKAWNKLQDKINLTGLSSSKIYFDFDEVRKIVEREGKNHCHFLGF